MLNLQDRNWSAFHLTKLFDSIQRGKRLKRADQQQGTIPYVSSSGLSNGVDGFISKAAGCRVFSNCISLANSGSVGSAFYEPFEFVASDHITHLKRKGLKKEHYLFIVAALSKQASNFNFNREINDQRIQGMQVMLPVDGLGAPDWQFMEDYISEREAIQVERCREFLTKRIASIERERESNHTSQVLPRLSEKTWKKFKAFGPDGLFDIKTTSSSIDAIRLIKDGDHSCPYITRTDRDNGIARFVSARNKKSGCDKAGTITIGLDTQTAFLQPRDYVTGQNIQVVSGSNLTEYVAFFLLPLLRSQMRAKFNWGGNGATLGRLMRLQLMLPVTDNGAPDYSYMDSYGRLVTLIQLKKQLDSLPL